MNEKLIKILKIIVELDKILKCIDEYENDFMLIASEQNAYLG